MMNNDKKDILQLGEIIATVGLIIGFILLILSFIANAYNRDYILTMLSGGIMIASMVFFGFSLVLSLMVESSKNEVTAEVKVE